MGLNQDVPANRYVYPDYVSALAPDHPVRTYFDESFHLRGILSAITVTDASDEPQKFFNLFNQLSEVEKRFARKENQLFPFLEKRGWDGPSRGMWAFHDAIRDLFRGVRKKLEAREVRGLNDDIMAINAELQHLMHVEEVRLFPHALHLLTPEDWAQMRLGEAEIGWMIEPRHASQEKEVSVAPPVSVPDDGKIRLDEGYLTPAQVSLLLKFIPVDLTYVDENDRVVFYNRGEERVFPRSAGIIGREVRFCHPPKSVATVLRILEAFKSGEKDEAEFWINYKSRVVHIRYFAVRDSEKKYRGVIEMSQDVTDIQGLKGEQ
ncbi:MAG: PAS domain-containing protein, partial [Bdellovibrionaceae bacterium]|nr:PAS domain-containing protein [Pseudobdellovibrionaceae bacterium]